MLAWIGVAVLSVSWLFGVGYYHPAHWVAWSATVLVGTALLLKTNPGRATRAQLLTVLIVLLPAIYLVPWPYRIAPLLLAVGAAILLIPHRWSWPGHIAGAALGAGFVLLLQGLALSGYEAVTARSHELPPPLPDVIGGAARLLGIEVGVHGTTLALGSMRETHRLGATWELLLDPVTWCFVAGGAAWLLWTSWTASPHAPRWRRLALGLLGLLLPIAFWLPVRAALLMAIYLHDVLRTDYDAPLVAMRLFWNSWLHLVMLAVPVLCAWRFIPRPDGKDKLPEPAKLSLPAGWATCALVALAAAVLTAAVCWDPVGTRKQGRVIFEEYNPDPEKVWERTDKPFDTEWYGHLSGYNYYCIYDYCSRFYDVSRLTEPITDRRLEACDVLIVKVPTRPFSPAESRSIRRFVERGGGLLLIGEHTNVFRSGTYLNGIARRFGFRFRHDCLFGIDKVFKQKYNPPMLPHPVVQHMPPLDFATSCSIDPAGSSGRAVIRAVGLKNKMADYHVDNYYPQPSNRADMRYGAFVQLWSMRHGKGRVLAFSDSTIFSNFSTFEPGKPELMLGMIEWLNRRDRMVDPRPWLTVLGLILLLGAAWTVRRWDIWPPILVAAGLLGWSAAAAGVGLAHRVAMPPPTPQRPFVQVIMDRTVSDAQLPVNGFISGEDRGFGIFERWILRLGYFTARRLGADVFRGDLAVFAYPNKTVSEAFRRQLVAYVEAGGNVLVIDSPNNENSTAGELLEPFDLSTGAPTAGGMLQTPQGWPSVPSEEALTVAGGTPFIFLSEKPVATRQRHGKGSVTVVGFGHRFCDARMGVTGDVEPDEALREVFELQFLLVRSMVEAGLDELATQPEANNVTQP
jgi:hypothetical protein